MCVLGLCATHAHALETLMAPVRDRLHLEDAGQIDAGQGWADGCCPRRQHQDVIAVGAAGAAGGVAGGDGARLYVVQRAAAT
jgi:hypothetical protein